MYRYQIRLITIEDILEFVQIASDEKGKVQLSDGNSFCVNGKNLLGTMSTTEWMSLYCESENDIYSQIKKFCIGGVA